MSGAHVAIMQPCLLWLCSPVCWYAYNAALSAGGLVAIIECRLEGIEGKAKP